MEMIWRDYSARELLGDIRGKTSSDWLAPNFRSIMSGWLYFSSTALVYIGDGAVRVADGAPKNSDRIMHARFADLGTAKLTAPFIAPNGIVEFAGGLALQGRKKSMKLLYKLASSAPGA